MMGSTGDPARIVLDTNVVLDWLLFDDPAVRQVGQAVTRGMLVWIATQAMRDEHFDVLGRALLRRWSPDVAAHRRAWDAHCRLIDAPTPAPARMRCADPDDQMFVDFARAERPAWLLSRDKALLTLAFRFEPYGVRVTTPAGWAGT